MGAYGVVLARCAVVRSLPSVSIALIRSCNFAGWEYPFIGVERCRLVFLPMPMEIQMRKHDVRPVRVLLAASICIIASNDVAAKSGNAAQQDSADSSERTSEQLWVEISNAHRVGQINIHGPWGSSLAPEKGAQDSSLTPNKGGMLATSSPFRNVSGFRNT